MLLDEIQTPCVLIDDRRLEQNLQQMQERALQNEVQLRPHVKTHKSLEIAGRQLANGARGLTVATVGEAEVFASICDDVRIAYTLVGREKLERAVALARSIRLSICADTPEGVRAAANAFETAGVEADILLEIDTGHHRTGIAWDSHRLVDVARMIADAPALRLAGLLTHGGHGYWGPEEGESPVDALSRRAAEERDRILEAALRLQDAKLAIPPPARERFEISIGSTPTMAAFRNLDRGGWRITEIRPGNYVFHDAMQVALGAATLSQCALTVLATVVSKHRGPEGSERVYIDAGKKVLTTDTGYGTPEYGALLYNAENMTVLPHAHLTGLSEEHGWISVRGGSTLSVGDRVRLVPNHACVVVATQPRLFLTSGEEVIAELPVDARDAR